MPVKILQNSCETNGALRFHPSYSCSYILDSELTRPCYRSKKVQRGLLISRGSLGSIEVSLNFVIQLVLSSLEHMYFLPAQYTSRNFSYLSVMHCYHFQVKSTKHVANPELLAPLPLHNLTHPGSAGQSSSSAVIPCDTAQDNLLATSPPAEFASEENEKLLPKEREF